MYWCFNESQLKKALADFAKEMQNKKGLDETDAHTNAYVAKDFLNSDAAKQNKLILLSAEELKKQQQEQSDENLNKPKDVVNNL